MVNNKYTIATLASHSALQILKGAKDEGFETLCFVKKDNYDFYSNYTFIDNFEVLNDYTELTAIEKKYNSTKLIVIPHGSFVAYLGEKFDTKTGLKYFGNKKILAVEADRTLQSKWLNSAGIKTPIVFTDARLVDRPVIIKTYGAKGGQGYSLCSDMGSIKKTIKSLGNQKYIIQEYIVGAPVYIQFFYSLIKNKLEITGCDRRYESTIDGIGRIPAHMHNKLALDPSFTVVGNFPIVLRESLLPKIYKMGLDIVKKSVILAPPRGLFGPFCLETVIDGDMNVVAIEISCRIVAGTNLFINGSPYMDLIYNKPVSMGRRIAMEIKQALNENNIQQILT